MMRLFYNDTSTVNNAQSGVSGVFGCQTYKQIALPLARRDGVLHVLGCRTFYKGCNGD